MRGIAALMVAALTLGFAVAAPLPLVVEELKKDGLPVSEAEEARVQGLLSKDMDGSHVFKLQKDKTYGIELATTSFKGQVALDIGGKKMTLVPDKSGKVHFKAPGDGPCKLTVLAAAGGAGKYVLTVKQLAGPVLRPGVHLVGPGGLDIQSALDNNDQPDRVRKYRCKVFEVKMDGGKTYTIDMTAQWDSYLRLEDENMKELAQDDDGGGFPNARIVIQAPANGVYRVITTSFSGGLGPFNLKIREGN